MKKPKIVVIVGQTASGKSSLGIKLAKKFNGEIVSADSRQVYTGLDLGTGKVTKKEMQGIPHHLLNVASPKQIYTVSHYIQDAKKAIQAILDKGKLPIIVGGTGFYIDALTEGALLPEVPPNISLRKELEKYKPEKLFSILKKIDPKRSKNIDPKNSVRLIRAIEIAKAIGSTPPIKNTRTYDVLRIGIAIDQEKLKKNISRRLNDRIKKGMVNEVKKLHKSGLSWKRMESLGLEYRYLARFLKKKITKAELITELNKEILSYAKRQKTWFKRNKQTHWIQPNDKNTAKKLIESFIDKNKQT